jgi:hypothetical protein
MFLDLSKSRRFSISITSISHQDIVKLHTQLAELAASFPCQDVLAVGLNDPSKPSCLVFVGCCTTRRGSTIHISGLFRTEALVEESRVVACKLRAWFVRVGGGLCDVD